jgi:hypothetical protein
MSNFKQLDYETYNSYEEFKKLINTNQISFQMHNQICINTTPEFPNDMSVGCGSLYYDWSKKEKISDSNGNVKITASLRDVPLREEDFTILNEQFKNTVFENIYNKLQEKYILGRVRIMMTKPNGCLSWHHDTSPRVHYPIKTQDGCFMVIEDEVKFLPADSWWYTNTTKKHTAFNGSNENRIHLVAVLLGDR